MSFHTILIMKTAFTFRRNIWKTHIVLPFINTTIMTIIIPSLHALFHIVNHLSSFRLIIYCYHIHMIERSKWTCDFKIIICCYHIFFKEWSNSIGRISRLFIKVLVIIISSLWCIDSNSMSYPYKACYSIILWDLNPITVHQNSNWCLTLLVW